MIDHHEAIQPVCGESHPLSRVQCDLFCQGCGESLFDQPVWRTEEASLLVARCPRCRVLVSANEALPYRRAWRQRFGITLMLTWFGVLAGVAIAVFACEMVLQQDSAPLALENVPGMRGSYSYPRMRMAWERLEERVRLTVPLSLVLAFAAGCVLVCAVYHWCMWWHLLAAAALPLSGMGLIWLERVIGNERDYYDLWWSEGAYLVVLGIAGLQIIGGMIGVVVGRPVARGVLRVLLPNRSRQFFAFLWRRDGLDVPTGRF